MANTKPFVQPSPAAAVTAADEDAPPPATAFIAAVAPRPAGAAQTTLPDIAVANTEAGSAAVATPRRVNAFRSLSSARDTRILAASSETPSVAPTWACDFFS